MSVEYGKCSVCECPDDMVSPCYNCKKNRLCISCSLVCKECKEEFCKDCLINRTNIAPSDCSKHLPMKQSSLLIGNVSLGRYKKIDTTVIK